MIGLCYAVATPETADTSMLAMRGPLADSFGLLARLGYRAVELMVRDPAQLDPVEIQRRAQDLNLTIAAVSTGQLRKEDGLSLNQADSRARVQAVDRARSVIDFAARLGAQVNIGTFRGHLPAPGPDRETARAAAHTSFTELVEYAAHTQVALAVEPQCRYVINWLNTVEETVQWNGQFGAKAPGVLFDLYHAMLEEESPHASLTRWIQHITLIQISDTNRRAPGRGFWNFAESLRMLDALKFAGFVSIECIQHPTGAQAAEHAIRYLSSISEPLSRTARAE